MSDSASCWNGALPGAVGQPVSVSLFLPGGTRFACPLVVFVPGFKGFKDWGSWSWMARRLAARELAVLTVNLSHNGVEGHGTEFNRLDLFQGDTWGRRVQDLEAVLTWVRSRQFPGFGMVDAGRLGLAGHSMGGGLVLLVASEDRDVRSVATLAGVSTVDRFTSEQKEAARRDGYIPFLNARTGQEMRVGRALLDEIEADPARFDILAAARRLRGRPVLVVQGRDDPAVRVEEAQALAEAVGDTAALTVLDQAGHTFGSRHPPDDPPSEPFPSVCDELAGFFGNSLT